MVDPETLVHAFVSYRLDYYNTLSLAYLKKTINRLQHVQNTAARILTKTRKFNHITPVLISLLWLSVHVRSDFKILLLTYKILMDLHHPIYHP